MPLVRLCAGCGRAIDNGLTRCPACATADNRRRAILNIKRGTNTSRWRKLRAHAVGRDGWCQRCGTSADLTVHLDPALAGDHRAATAADVVVLCRRCHGALDAPRASRPQFLGGVPALPRQHAEEVEIILTSRRLSPARLSTRFSGASRLQRSSTSSLRICRGSITSQPPNIEKPLRSAGSFRRSIAGARYGPISDLRIPLESSVEWPTSTA